MLHNVSIRFLYRGWEVNTQGNLFTHAILRGYENKHGPITGVESNLHLEGGELKCNANV